MIEALKGLDTSIPAQRARALAAMQFEPKLLYTAGTNLKGIHGAGGAKFAREEFGLPIGKFEGIHGRTIGVPTRTGPPITTLGENELRGSLLNFRETLEAHPGALALLPRIGMGKAGVPKDRMLGLMDETGLFKMGEQIVPTSEMVLAGFPETAARMRLLERMRKLTPFKKAFAEENEKNIGANIVAMIKGKIEIPENLKAEGVPFQTYLINTVKNITDDFKIISGGQIGSDEIGLRIGKSLGIPTGGTAPPKFLTAKGSNYKLRDEYGLEELVRGTGIDRSRGGHMQSLDYRERTILNIANSDGTIVVANNWKSPGSLLTLKEARREGHGLLKSTDIKSKDDVINWIINNEISTINIAGNRNVSDRHPAFKHIYEALKELKEIGG